MMERDSFLYKARRKLQCLAYDCLPKKFLCKLYSWIVLKHSVNLSNPKTFNEKIQWLKLYEFPEDKLVIKCADKYRVREYVSSKGLAKLLVPLLGDWENAENIDWKRLPQKFALKCNHGCAYNVICSDKNKLSEKKTKEILNNWMKEDFGKFNVETHYSLIHPHIICEEYMGEKITDFKFFCFNGKPKYMYISKDLAHDREAQIGFFYLNGEKMPMHRDDYKDLLEAELPIFYEEMLLAAQILSEDFKFVRVDFILANGRFYFSELTFTPGGGMMSFNPCSYDLEWGNMIDIGN